MKRLDDALPTIAFPDARARLRAVRACARAGALAATICAAATPSVAQDTAQQDGPTADEPIIEPQLERRAVVLPRIDTEDFETGIYVGLYSLENFGTSTVIGGSVSYHVIEDVFFDLSAAASEVRDTPYRQIGINIFPKENEVLYYYNLSVGYNVLPGELFLGRDRAFTAALYVIGGVGNTHLAKEDFFTYNLGTGVRVLAADWAAFHVDVRDYMFDTDLLGSNKTSHNIEWRLGLSIFF